jgi:hypothetical protein
MAGPDYLEAGVSAEGGAGVFCGVASGTGLAGKYRGPVWPQAATAPVKAIDKDRMTERGKSKKDFTIRMMIKIPIWETSWSVA